MWLWTDEERAGPLRWFACDAGAGTAAEEVRLRQDQESAGSLRRFAREVKVAERSGNRWNDVRLAAFAACAPTSGPFDPFLAGAARGLARIRGCFPSERHIC